MENLTVGLLSEKAGVKQITRKKGDALLTSAVSRAKQKKNYGRIRI